MSCDAARLAAVGGPEESKVRMHIAPEAHRDAHPNLTFLGTARFAPSVAQAS